MHKIIITFLAVSFTVLSYGQIDSRQHFVIKKTVDNQFYFDHNVEKGQNLYAISKLYTVMTRDLLIINSDIDKDNISLNQKIKIPLTGSQQWETEGGDIVLEYIVQPQETFYTIGKKYFQQRISEIKRLNGIQTNELSVGQQLIIGYLSTQKLENTRKEIVQNKKIVQISKPSKITDEANIQQEESSYTMAQLLKMIESEVEEEEEEEEYLAATDTTIVEENFTRELTSEKGIAYTETATVSSDDYFVLHPKAKINSSIELYNPMMNKSIMATVISELPNDLYPSNISVVISPSVAQALGARDRQFRIEMKYEED